MLKKIISEKFYCGLDIGSQNVKAALLRARDGKDVSVVAVYENKTQGFKDLSVRDLAELSEGIHTAVAALSKQANLKIRDVELGIGGELVDIRSTSAVIPLIDKGSKIITQVDLKKINHQANLLGLKMDEDTLHEIPQSYLVDDVNTSLNPLGLYGRKLGVESLMIVTNINRIRNITHAVHQAGYEVSDLWFGTFAAAGVIFTEAEKKQGCILLDIGSRATSILIFKDGILKSFTKVNIAGNQWTQSIAAQLNLSFELAEDLKRSYAVAGSEDQRQKEEILIKKESQYVPIKREVIYQAIEPDILSLVQSIREALTQAEITLDKKMVMAAIGGGVLLPGLIERIEKELGIPVNLGKINIPAENMTSHLSAFTSAVGLAYGSFKQRQRLSTLKEPAHWRNSFANRLKELYEEYF